MKTVYILDDDNTITETLEFFLSAYFTIKTATDPQAFLKDCQRICPDLFLLDLWMPKISGFEVIKLIRNMSEFQYTPIILMSAIGIGESQTAYSCGANLYISKPFSLTDMRQHIDHLISKHSSEFKIKSKEKDTNEKSIVA